MALRGMAAPVVDADTKPFWDGLAQRRLLIPHCAACGTGRWPPGPTCHACGSEQTDWRETPGPARLYSYVVVTHPTHPALVDQVPYVVALAEVAPGVRLLGNIVNWSGGDLADGTPLDIIFEDRDDGLTIYNFRQ